MSKTDETNNNNISNSIITDKNIKKENKKGNFKKTMARLFVYLGAFKYAFLCAAVIAVIATVCYVLGPKILGEAVTEILNGFLARLSGTGDVDFVKIGKILIVLFIIYLISTFFSIIQSQIMASVSQKLCFRLREEIVAKINRMPVSYFESSTVGDVLSRITNDVDTFGTSLNQSVTPMITSAVNVVGTIIVMISISPMLTLGALIILPVSMLIISTIVKLSQKHFKAQQKLLGSIDGQIEETFSGHMIVKAFNREDSEIEIFDKTNTKLYKATWKSQFLSGLMQPIMTYLSNVAYIFIAVFGAMFAAKGTMTIGGITAFIQYIKRFTQPITEFANSANILQSLAASAERIFEFLDEKEEVTDCSTPSDPKDIDGTVTFTNVKFGYVPEKIIIKNFSFTATPGSMIAIVGPTGAGKTTLIKLIMRFYEVGGGSIAIGGNDITSYRRKELRDAIGMVLQETWLFHGTIMENIRYGRIEATDEEVIEAAKAARADHFIRSLPDGYNMVLSEDASNISQGQKQLLTIARAILANSRMMILDEATSSVDTRTEALIQSAMEKLMEGRTSFVIAHRLSTIRNANAILVMKDGDIIEQGTHEELMAKRGFYSELYNSQFEQL